MKILIVILSLMMSIQGGDLPASLEKKVRKTLSRSFDQESIILEKIDIGHKNDNKPDPGLSVYYLLAEDDTIGYLAVTTAIGRYDYFDYCVIYNPDLSIRKVEVLVYRSDHGYEIASKKWLKQFDGTDGCELEYGSDIDAISGATLSATSITNDIRKLCEILGEL